jgi:hypothetical protein
MTSGIDLPPATRLQWINHVPADTAGDRGIMDQDHWKPKIRPDCDVRRLRLDEAEGYVLSRLDGQTTLRELAMITGFPPERIGRIMARLAVMGVLEDVPSESPPAADHSPAPAGGEEPLVVQETAAPYVAVPDGPGDAEEAPLDEGAAEDMEILVGESMTADLEEIFAPPDSPAGMEVDDGEESAAETTGPDDEVDDMATVLLEPFPEEDLAGDGLEEEDGPAPEEIVDDSTGEDLNFRRLFEEKLSRVPVEKRRLLAARAIDPALAALCFDADPGVIRGILANPAADLRHARLVARHHRNPVGLSVLSSKHLQDDQVQRGLLRNNQASDVLLQKIMNIKPLQIMYQLCVSRELSERAKHMSRLVFRRKFQQGSAEECAAIIVNTAGRCLMLLTGLGLDSGTAMLLCRRNLSSTQLIQNLARFAGTPPALIQHLFRQPLVRRNFNLKRLLLQHPNCPSKLKE